MTLALALELFNARCTEPELCTDGMQALGQRRAEVQRCTGLGA